MDLDFISDFIKIHNIDNCETTHASSVAQLLPDKLKWVLHKFLQRRSDSLHQFV